MKLIIEILIVEGSFFAAAAAAVIVVVLHRNILKLPPIYHE